LKLAEEFRCFTQSNPHRGQFLVELQSVCILSGSLPLPIKVWVTPVEKAAFELLAHREMIVTSTDPYDKLTDAQICEVLFRRSQEVAQ
jgi:hypothetical protein